MNKTKEEKIIMRESPEAAEYRTNIEGWVSSNGHFWGEDERAARYDGSTHHRCECGGIAERAYTICEKCRRKAANERYQNMPYKEWDGKEPICLYDGDEFFFDEDSLRDWLYDHELNGSDVQLVICLPLNYQSIDCETIASDSWEGWEPSDELEKKINEFNDYLRTLPPHSYTAGKIRTAYDYTYVPED